MQKDKKLTFLRHYKKLKNERAEFVKQMMILTGKSERTIYFWIKGRQKPQGDSLEKLVKHFDQTPEELFPEAIKSDESCK
jgi:transcriptional regulator with XRE-family HTH domain